MRLEDLRPAPGAKRKPKRIGRGPGSGHGKTSTRGHKGQKARSGGGKPPGFEGGQMPLYRRVPKRGFVNLFRKEYAVVNVGALAVFPPEATVDPPALVAHRLIKKSKRDAVKILGEGELGRPLRVRAHAFSQSALAKIQAAGGQGEVLP